MENLQIFKNSEFGEIGILLIDGREYFPATQCAKILGYARPHNAIKQHCRGSLKQGVIDRLGRNQEMIFIPEGDLCRLIVHSKLPAAERFERWLFDEVLPSIRKQGAYIPAGQLPADVIAGLIRQTAAAVVAEVVRQIVPLMRDVAVPAPQPAVAEYEEYREPSYDGRCKLERFPMSLRGEVNQMLEEMLEEQTLNFSRIARFCTVKGFPITSPSVKTYFARRFGGQ